MLPFKKLMHVSFKSLFRNRMRSLLTSLGIIIGVSAVIIMVGVGAGSQEQIEESIQSLGTNLIIVFPGTSRMGGVSRGAGSYNTLTLEDVEAIRSRATLIEAASAVVIDRAQIIGGISNWNTQIQGVSEEYLDIRDWQLVSGTFFSDRDIRSNRKVCVLGQTVAEELFGNRNPAGERIRVDNTPFTVIGVLQEKGQDPRGADQDDIILAPSTTVLYRLKGGTRINMIQVSAISQEWMEEAQKELEDILRTEHRLTGSEEADFRIRTQTEITDMATSTSKTMTLLLGAVAAVSLIVGGIGIMNIMLVSVTERTREIGIRMSMGARSSDILVQFLTEAVVLSLVGGIIGILLAVAVAGILNTWTTIYTLIQPVVVMLSFAFSGAVGVFFGWFPARKAATLNPIEALRYE